MFDLSRIDLTANKVHVLSAYIPSMYHNLENLWQILSDKEKNQANKFINNYLKNNYIISHALLRNILSFYINVNPQDIKYSINEFGKPFLKNGMHKIQFNMSHSNDYVAYIIAADYQVGIDIEWKDKNINIHEIAELALSPMEIIILNTLDTEEKNSFFYNIWTKKEAIVKAVGQGLTYPIQKIEVMNLINNTIIKNSVHKNIFYYSILDNLKNYAGAIASTRKIESIIQNNI